MSFVKPRTVFTSGVRTRVGVTIQQSQQDKLFDLDEISAKKFGIRRKSNSI